MSDIVLVAIITGTFSLVAAVVSALITGNKATTEMRISQAKTDVKIENLTNEVRAHNNFAQRMPALEARFEGLDKRLTALERAG